MIIERVEVAIALGFTENSYLVYEGKEAEEVLIVDPGAQPGLILEKLNNRKVLSIVLTHRHYDHVGAVSELVKTTGASVLAHSIDANVLREEFANGLKGKIKKAFPIDRMLEDGDTIPIKNCHLRVLHTPGHTAGSICLYDEEGKNLIAGDTMFFEAVGRTDLYGGDAGQQRESIKKLFGLPDETRVYPGHDKNTSIGHEKTHGPLAYLA